MSRVAVAAASRTAADVGQLVASVGGNAVDVAVAAVVASMTSELGIVSPGAGGFITIWPTGEEPVVIDAYAAMPGKGRSAAEPVHTIPATMAYGGGTQTIVGWGSVAIPGAFAGLDAAWRRYGSLPWRDLVEPSIHLAEAGFRLSPPSAFYLRYSHNCVFGWDDETRPTYSRPNGDSLQEGDLIRIPGLGKCLSAIANEGAETVYQGEVAAALVAASKDRGGLITTRDLADYSPLIRSPWRAKFYGWDIATNAPPAVGGVTLAALLTLIDRGGLTGGWSRDNVAFHAAAQQAIFGFRSKNLDGDTDRFVGADLLREFVSGSDLSTFRPSPSTVHIASADDSGLACSVTVSSGYGSGATIPGYGFGLNNSLGELELTHEGLHALPPGQRLLSNMAPTVARSLNGDVLAIGSAGADRITSAIANVLYSYFSCDMDLEASVAAPRLHVDITTHPPTLLVEQGLDTSKVLKQSSVELPTSMYFGGVQTVSYSTKGVLRAAADPRRSGAVAFADHSEEPDGQHSALSSQD